MPEREEIIARIEELRARLEELNDSIPAHSSTIYHIAQIEDIEEELEALERELLSLN